MAKTLDGIIESIGLGKEVLMNSKLNKKYQELKHAQAEAVDLAEKLWLRAKSLRNRIPAVDPIPVVENSPVVATLIIHYNTDHHIPMRPDGSNLEFMGGLVVGEVSSRYLDLDHAIPTVVFVDVDGKTNPDDVDIVKLRNKVAKKNTKNEPRPYPTDLSVMGGVEVIIPPECEAALLDIYSKVIKPVAPAERGTRKTNGKTKTEEPKKQSEGSTKQATKRRTAGNNRTVKSGVSDAKRSNRTDISDGFDRNTETGTGDSSHQSD